MASVDFPFVLEQVFFTKNVVIALQGHDPATSKIGVPVNAINASKIADSPGLYQVVMQSSLNLERDLSCPYMVDMEVVAMMRMVGDLDEGKSSAAVMQLGHTVCYGAIRESLAWITGRHPYGPLLLGFSLLQTNPVESAET